MPTMEEIISSVGQGMPSSITKAVANPISKTFMAGFGILKDAFNQNDVVTHDDILAAIKVKYPKYAEADNAKLAQAVAQKDPTLSFLAQYDPKAEVSPSVVPQPLRTDEFYQKHPDLGQQDAMKVIDQTKAKYPKYADADPVKLATAMETKNPEKFKGLAARLTIPEASPVTKATVEGVGLMNPTKVAGEVVKPIVNATERAVSGIDMKGARETWELMKSAPDDVHNVLLRGLLKVPDQIAGVGIGGEKDLAIAGALELGGTYKGLTGLDLEIQPQTLQTIRDRKISPEIADAAGQIIGGLALLKGVSSVMRTGELGGWVWNQFIANPKIARFVAPMVTGGVDFGGAGAVKEGIQQIKTGKLDMERFGKVVLTDTADGMIFGGTQAFSSGIARTAGAAAYGYGSTLAAGGDHVEAMVQGSLMGLFSLANSVDVTRSQKVGGYNAARWNIREAARTSAEQKGYTPEQVKDITSTAEKSFTDFVAQAGGPENFKVKDFENGAKKIYGAINEKMKAPEKPSESWKATGEPPAPPAGTELPPPVDLVTKPSTELQPISPVPTPTGETPTPIGTNVPTEKAVGTESIPVAEPSNPAPAIGQDSQQNGIITDPAQVQEIKNSISEGEMILKSGRSVIGRKMSPEELKMVQRSVDNSKAKIGLSETPPPPTPGMVEPVTKPVAQKEPWEYSKNEYLSLVVDAIKRETNHGGLTEKQAIRMHSLAAVTNHEFFVKEALASGKPVPPEVLKDYPDLQQSKEPWQMTWKEYKDSPLADEVKSKYKTVVLGEVATSKAHRKLIEKAVSSGAPVPAEVLKDYPDLTTSSKADLKENLSDAEVVKVEKPQAVYEEIEIPGGTTKDIKEQILRGLKQIDVRVDGNVQFDSKGDPKTRQTYDAKGRAFDNTALAESKVADHPIRIAIPNDGTFIIKPTKYAVQKAIKIFTRADRRTFESIRGSLGSALHYDKPVQSTAPLGMGKGVVDLKPKKKGRKSIPGGSGSGDTTQIDNFEATKTQEVQATGEPFKLFDESRKIIEKYAARVGERYVPRDYLGVHYRNTGTIRVKALNNISVVAHETTHYIDQKEGVVAPLVRKVGETENGIQKYDPAFRALRKELTRIYLEYYPGGRKEHNLEKRMKEGLAVLFQHFVSEPESIKAKYPMLVDEILKPSGRLYKPVFTEFLNDLRAIVKKYQAQDALGKVGARVTSQFQQKEIKDSYLNLSDKVIQQTIDAIYPIEKLAKEAGLNRTAGDPSLWLRMYNNSSALILNNLKGKKGFWTFKNGEFSKTNDKNIGNLIEDLQTTGLSDDFGYWLVARREHFAYIELDTLKAQAVEAAKRLKDFMEKSRQRIIISSYDPKADQKAVEQFKRLRDVLKNDGFSRDVVTKAYEENKAQFEKHAELFDAITHENLRMMADPGVRLISSKQYSEMTQREGYASFKRDVYDEVLGSGEESLPQFRVGKTKVSSTIGRKGSQLTIINPLYSLVKDHAEIVRKALKQTVYNKMVDLSGQFPDLFQKLPLQTSVDEKTGALSYPQEKDPNIIMGRDADGKRVPILTSREIKEVLDDVLTYQNVHILESLLRGASRFFTKGTTGAYPFFAPTNLVIDSITAAAQTQTKMVPIYDALHSLGRALLNHGSKESDFLTEYMVMGGERQTFVHWQDLPPDELFKKINGEKTKLEYIAEKINQGMDILAMPSGMSEIFTRATEYIRSRMQGNDQIVAMEDAGRITAPFHHVGKWGGGVGRTAIKSIPFFNPALQVLAQYARTIKNPATRNRALFVNLALIAAMIGSTAYIAENATEAQRQLYKDLEPSELANYVWFHHPDGKRLIKVRFPEQMGFLAMPINMYLAHERMGAQYTVGEYIDGLTAFLPNQLDTTEPVRMFYSWLPQLIKPALAVATNTRDYPKIRPLESKGMAYKEPRYRFNENTSDFAKYLGEKMNLSPVKIDYLIEGYAGRITRFITGKPVTNPFVKEYYFTAGRNLQDYYEMRDATLHEVNAYKKKDREFSNSELQTLAKRDGQIKIIEKELDVYRYYQGKKDETRMSQLRTKILDGIGALR